MCVMLQAQEVGSLLCAFWIDAGNEVAFDVVAVHVCVVSTNDVRNTTAGEEGVAGTAEESCGFASRYASGVKVGLTEKAWFLGSHWVSPLGSEVQGR